MSHEVKIGDTKRKWTDTLTLAGVAVNLTGATVVLVIKKPDSTVVRRSASIVSAANGQVEYQPVSGDVDAVGERLLEWEVTFGDGKVLTVPSAGYIHLTVVAELG